MTTPRDVRDEMGRTGPEGTPLFESAEDARLLAGIKAAFAVPPADGVAERHLAAIVEEAQRVADVPVVRIHDRRARPWRVAAASLAAALTAAMSLTTLAYAGAITLPEPAADVLGWIGIDLRDADVDGKDAVNPVPRPSSIETPAGAPEDEQAGPADATPGPKPTKDGEDRPRRKPTPRSEPDQADESKSGKGGDVAEQPGDGGDDADGTDGSTDGGDNAGSLTTGGGDSADGSSGGGDVAP